MQPPSHEKFVKTDLNHAPHSVSADLLRVFRTLSLDDVLAWILKHRGDPRLDALRKMPEFSDVDSLVKTTGALSEIAALTPDAWECLAREWAKNARERYFLSASHTPSLREFTCDILESLTEARTQKPHRSPCAEPTPPTPETGFAAPNDGNDVGDVGDMHDFLSRLTPIAFRQASVLVRWIETHREAEAASFATDEAAHYWSNLSELTTLEWYGNGEKLPFKRALALRLLASQSQTQDNTTSDGASNSNFYSNSESCCRQLLDAWILQERIPKASNKMLPFRLIRALIRRETFARHDMTDLLAMHPTPENLESAWKTLDAPLPPDISFTRDIDANGVTSDAQGSDISSSKSIPSFLVPMTACVLAQAWCESGSPERGADFLESTLMHASWRDGLQSSMQDTQDDGAYPILWLSLARAAVQAKDFGKAVYALEQAKLATPRVAVQFAAHAKAHAILKEETWAQWRHDVGEELADAALQQAYDAHEIDPPMLSLALQYGDAQTLSAAALCAFDAADRDTSPLFDDAACALARHRHACGVFLTQILERIENIDRDKLFQFYTLYLKAQSAEEQHQAETQIFEALTQFDAPQVAADTLSRAFHRIPNEDALFWACANLFIDLCLKTGELDRAISELAQDFCRDTPYATCCFLRLMAQVPREAYRFLLSLLNENLGTVKTQTLFEKLQSASDPYSALKRAMAEIQEKKHAPRPRVAFETLLVSILPLECQIAYRAKRLSSPNPQENAQSQRRRDVLLARGFLDRVSPMPEPQPANWIKKRTPKASDALKK